MSASTVATAPHDPKLAALYGRNVTTPMRWPLRRTIAATLTFGALYALHEAANPIVLLTAGTWIAAVAWVIATYLLSAFCRVARSPRVCYRLRDRRFSVLYLGRTRDWLERFDAHTDTAEDHDRPWRYRIDAEHSGPFRWCLTPFGEWACERFRIRQAVTLARLRLAPKVYNRQLSTPYRSPMIVPAVLIWFVEEMLFGIGYEGRKDPQVSDYDPNPSHEPADEPDMEPVDEADPDTEPQGSDNADPWDAALVDLLSGAFGDTASSAVPEQRKTSPIGDGDMPLFPVGEPGLPGPAEGSNEPRGHDSQTQPSEAIDSTPANDCEPTPTDVARGGATDVPGTVRGGGVDGSVSESDPGAAGGGRRCKREGCNAPAEVGPRCKPHHNEHQRQRKADYRRRLNEMMPEGDDE